MSATLLTTVALAAMLTAGEEPAKPPAKPPPFIAVADKVPTQWQPVVVVLRHEVGRLEAVYAPNSKVAKRHAITPTKQDRRAFAWTPEYAGLVKLEAYALAKPPADAKAKKTEKPVATVVLSVAFDGAPGSGVLIMLLAGLILFGGAFVALRSIMRD